MPFLDVPAAPGESSLSANPESLPHLKLKPGDPGPAAVPRRGAKLQQVEIEPKVSYELPIRPLFPANAILTLISQASFVIKTQLQTPHHLSGSPPLTKVFVNVTYAAEVPEQQDAEKLRGIVNCVVSDVRETADKAGKASLVIDATLASSPIQQSKRDKSYKQWLIQVILEKVEERMGVELNYTEPNIKCKGTLEPRTAVIPMDAETFERITAAKAKEKGIERIQLLEDEDVTGTTTAAPAPMSDAGSVGKSKVKGESKGKGRTEGPVDAGKPVDESAAATPKRSGKPVTPKHEFEVISSTGKDARNRFIMTISLPDEPISPVQDMSDIKLSLTPDHLEFSSRLYLLSSPLPRDIDVDSVLGHADGVEWSVEDKALRIQGWLK
ncbi:hypothetical protein QFC19_006176 [Naganishia cerealis]|uniref:Uncharacterized protein n=1 Tax=Naganishia cerealis TaxID=610337 RepID=A0ACC2VJ48_9TREE|nr:hypothetical protein QFC19_006176 [Naganishia cerealis]